MLVAKIYADFHNLDNFNHIRLTCAGTLADLARLRLVLREEMTLTLYTDDVDDEGNPDALLVDGVVRRNEEEDCWVAAVDWSALRHASDEKPALAGLNGTVASQPEAELTPPKE